MSDPIQTDGVARSFSNAAETYDHWARPQRIMAETLLSCMPDALPEGPILDVGCGTGLLTEYLLLKYQERPLLGIDLAPGMIDHCDALFLGMPQAAFAVADGETFDAPQPYALIASNYCFQWYQHLHDSMARLHAMLLPGGILAASVPVTGTLRELHDSFATTGFRPFPGLEFHDPEAYVTPLRDSGLNVLSVESKAITVPYDSALEALRSFKGVGATFEYQKDYKPLRPREVRELTKTYEARHRQPDGTVPVTYQSLFIIAEKTA